MAGRRSFFNIKDEKMEIIKEKVLASNCIGAITEYTIECSAEDVALARQANVLMDRLRKTIKIQEHIADCLHITFSTKGGKIIVQLHEHMVG